jgi:hypothetical protein
MSRPDNLRDDPGYWLCALILLMPPVWPILLVCAIWNSPGIYREWRAERDCKQRGHHLWGEYQDHPYWDIPHQYCQHCQRANPDSYAPLTCFASKPSGSP